MVDLEAGWFGSWLITLERILFYPFGKSTSVTKKTKKRTGTFAFHIITCSWIICYNYSHFKQLISLSNRNPYTCKQGWFKGPFWFPVFIKSLDLILSRSLFQSNKVPVVQHAHMHPLTPLITYSNEHFSPGTPPSHLSPEILDPKTGTAHFT